jgi:hypothetical protein
MKLWLPIAGAALFVVAYVYFYELSAAEAQGSASIGLANVAGLVAVVVGLVAAGMVMRRGPPNEKTP